MLRLFSAGHATRTGCYSTQVSQLLLQRRPLLPYLGVRHFTLPRNEEIDQQEVEPKVESDQKYQLHGGPTNPIKFEKWKESVIGNSATKIVNLKGSKKLTRVKFEIADGDLDEKFIKGFGKGGQKTNKTNNCVVMTHLPTGEVVKCHDGREQHQNRGRARKLLYERLDLLINPDSSTAALRVVRKQRSKSKASHRRNQKERQAEANAADIIVKEDSAHRPSKKKSRAQLKKEAWASDDEL